jgi:hypothetical protein
MTRRVLVSPSLPPISTGNAELDRKINAWQSEFIRHNFEDHSYLINFSSYGPGHTYLYGAGIDTDPTENTVALEAALLDNDEVFVGAGTYDPLTISASDKRLVMLPGVVIKLADGTVDAVDVTGPAVLAISGANVLIEGDFEINGNSANNDSSGFPTSVLTGALNISGDNCRINGTVTIRDAYWRGFTVENGNNSGDEVAGLYIKRLEVIEPVYYATLIWGVQDWGIDEIYVDRGTTPGWDARIRVGSQAASTVRALRGKIGSVKTNGVFVTEPNTHFLDVDSVQCGGGKLQESWRVNVGKWEANGQLLTDDQGGQSFAMIICDDCHIGTVSVYGHDQGAQATAFTQMNTNCSVDHLSVDETLTAYSDCIVGENVSLVIQSMVLLGAANGGNGFHYDHDADSDDNYIGALISTGHTTTDVLVESNADSNTPLQIGYINPNAVVSIGSAHSTDSFQWSSGTSSVTVNNPAVTSNSKILLFPRDIDAGVIIGTQGYYITPGSGSFQVFTGNAGNTAATSDWDYVVRNAL